MMKLDSYMGNIIIECKALVDQPITTNTLPYIVAAHPDEMEY